MKDIIATKEDFDNTYDLVVDQATISTYGLNLIKACTKFQEQAKTVMGAAHVLAGNNSAYSAMAQTSYLSILGALTGISWEIDDSQLLFRSPAGGTTQARYVPQNKLILTASSSDGDGSFWNFGNCVVDESTSRTIKGLDTGSRRGPYPYIGSPNGDDNPPGFTQWLASKGMSRRMVRRTNGVLTFA